MRAFGAIVIAIWASWLTGQPAHAAGGRVALVIGNSSYQNVARLANPINDAAVIAAMLRKAGFDSVDSRSDLRAVDMRRALREFGNKARDADVAVVYYAGHGIELDNTNYLIPVDASLETDTDIYDEAFPLDRLLVAVEPARKLRLIILDACRDNPFSKTMKRTVASRAIGRGLAKVEPASPNTMIAFAAKAGFTASDGDGKNSPFASALAKHLATPGLDLRKAFGFVRDDVLNATNNRQEPFIYGSLGGDDVSLVPAKPVVVAPASNPQADMRRDYELALQIGTRAIWISFLNTYPSGFYADLAKGQIDKITAEEARVAAADKVRLAQEEKARLTAEGAKQSDQTKADAQARKAEEAVIAAEKARQSALAKTAVAEQARNAAEKAAAEKAAKMKAEADAAAEAKRQAEEKAAAAKTAVEKAAAEAKVLAIEVLAIESSEKNESGSARKPEQTQIASLTPPSDPASAPEPTPDTGALVRSIKTELSRVGCYGGAIDDKWTTAKPSLGKFAKFARLSPPEQPGADLLDMIRRRSDRVCPPECSARQTESNGRCIAKTCPSDQVLDDDGSCEKRRSRTAARPPAAEAPEKETGRSSSAKPSSPQASGDAAAESKYIMPPGTIRTGETMTLTARNGRKMTCTGGRGHSVARTCFWN